MAENPYAFDPERSAWQAGYDGVILSPGEPEPYVGDPQYEAPYLEGLAAGRAEEEQDDLPDEDPKAPPVDGPNDPPEDPPVDPPDNGPVEVPADVLQTLTFWINAFIPDSTLTEYVSEGPGAAAGQYVLLIPDPPGRDRAFLGDSRGYSSDVAAGARIHSLVELTGLDHEVPVINAIDNRCGESVEIDRDTGGPIASATAPSDRIRFHKLRANMSVDPEGGVLEDSPSPRFVQLDYEAAANLPLLAGSPDIDMLGTLQIDRDARTFRFAGAVDGFPAFEAYVSFNLAPAVAVFTLPPIAPFYIIGDVKRNVDVTLAY